VTAVADDVRAVLSGVTDPEIPVLTIEDLGVLRDVMVDGDHVVVTVTPTYSGCPAMDEIRADIRRALADHGWPDVEVRTVLSPAWTTDDLTDTGRRRLREFGIAPPAPQVDGPVLVPFGRRPALACPQCGSSDTEELARFGSTSCKALWRCRACREPFDHFKAH
jgi:ring-1,2-phenylacetyl-CoA epoxidase subunit PaaD